ncbi:MAG: efflux RND transporter permease subunit [Pirellulales bacterium]|nr:efflux RND transporter permease subunit [Pirellulales bacterium]
MFSRIFIDRPIFAAVLSIVITIGGGVAVLTLPVAQYPEITPPTVQVTCVYPGASAKVVADTVAAPIEQQVNGVENMLYMSSQCTNDGTYNLTVTFKLGTNLDMAQVLVQNRVSIAMPTLPDVVKQTGVTTKKKSPAILLVVNLYSKTGEFDQLYMSNKATITIKDELARLEGVGDVTFLGQQDYSMRVWLDPKKLDALDMSAGDVVAALREQNIQVAAGQLGQPPAIKGTAFQYTLSTLGRLTSSKEFERIIIKTGKKGEIVRLGDVARVELGAKNQDQSCRLDGMPSVGLAIFQLPGTNAIDTSENVKLKMEELAKDFPPGLNYDIVYDTTPFIQESINEVYKALGEAIALVAIVVLVFLQNWRSTVIPLVAVPVSLVGTFAVMAGLGYTLNNLTLFGLVLAIGIVVDDAIVVVENVERWMEHGLSPKEAAYKSMEEVSLAVIAIAFSLSAVFIPTAFMSGITGQFFRQFALTIATATLISAFNSLTLSPALAAILLKPHGAKKDWLTRLLDLAFGWFFKGFNKVFNVTTGVYAGAVRHCVRASAIGLLVYGGLMYLTYYGFTVVPVGFIPDQDKGYLLVNVQLPDSASLERTQQVMDRIEKITHEIDGVKNTLVISGQSFLANANGSNFGSVYVILDEFHNRHGSEHTANAVAAKLRARYNHEIRDAIVSVFGAPPVDGLGNAGGFKLMVEDRGSRGLEPLQIQTDNLIAKGNAEPELVGLFSIFRANTPQLYVDIDRSRCKTMGVAMSDVFNALQYNLSNYYVNDFNRFDRTWQVIVQADEQYRMTPVDIERLKVRNDKGGMVPLGAVATVKNIAGPVMINRYQMYPATSISGGWTPGVSSGQAIEIMNDLGEENLPSGFKPEWTELTLLQNLAGNTAILIFPLCVLLVFLTQAAQYESFTLPLAIVLIVPMSLLCALAGVWLCGMDNNLFTQIGFVVLAGLACKNAVLIVEFAKQQREQGLSIHDAVVESARLRLRPIVMTSFAFILGVVPLMLASGAGAEMRSTLGTAVFYGMLGVTFFGLFLTPVFYNILQHLSEKFSGPARGEEKNDE